MKRTQRVVVGLIVGLATLGPVAPGRADSAGVTFEPPVYSFGSVHGQDGWSASGPYDQGVVPNKANVAGFGLQSFRMSNAVVSGSFGDQVFSKPVVNEAGESDAVGAPFSGGVRVRRFLASWQFASVTEVWQPGLAIGLSPDRGDGARMSLIRMVDNPLGMSIEFSEYRSGFSSPGCAAGNFLTNTIATRLSRFQPHTVAVLMDFVEGPANDIVRVYVDGSPTYAGASWEDFFRECQPPGSRTVDSLLFRASGTACDSCAGEGFLIDNVSMRSLGAVVVESGGSTSVTEGGATDTYTIRLETPPASPHAVRIDVLPEPGVSVSPAVLFFNTGNFAVPQTVTVTAVDDTVAEPPGTARIRHAAASFDPNFEAIPISDVLATVFDNDGMFVLAETQGSTVVSEAGAFDTYSFRLVSPPTDPVTITASPDAQVSVTPASRTFTPADWNVPQSFTISAVDDALVEGTPHSGTVSHAASSADAAFNGRPVPSVTASILDNDPSDTTPPAAPAITNCPGSSITSKTFLLTGTAEPFAAIEVWVNGTLAGSVLVDGNGFWSMLLRFNSNGTYSVSARAVDGSGNVGPFSPVCAITVAADFTPPPAPTITTPPQGAFTPTLVTVGGAAFGDTAMLRLYDNGVQIAEFAASAGPWSIQRLFPEGLHPLSARAVDAEGNVSALSNVRTITVDATPPDVTIFLPPNTILIQLGLPFGRYYLHGNARDVLSGVDRIEVTYQDLLLGTTTVSTGTTCSGCPSAPGVTVTWSDDPGLDPGLYDVTVRGYDRVGNVGFDDTLLLFVA